MKIAISLLLLLGKFWTNTPLVSEKDAILGVWYTEDKLSKIQIYETEGKYHGKVVWLKNQQGKSVLDAKNENKSLRNKPILGLIILSDFVHESKNVWTNGRVYDPESGKSYACRLTLKNNHTLDVRGYIGKPIFGKSVVFSRITEE
ncbi:DUF2147 domain-containing protein [Flectobacillus major]|uniref:DUF2147 domain-containing protein n=1 Tax=Flectobacillus major TaxID=103 RepID=UPI000408C2DE|nr:DUF2147 domain-containing protein [Flectobacillus major]